MPGFHIDLLIPALDESGKVLVIVSHASAPPLERVLIQILGGPDGSSQIVTGTRQAGVLARCIRGGIASGGPVFGLLDLTVRHRRGAGCRLDIKQDGKAVSIDLDPIDLVAIAETLLAIEAEARS